MLSVAVAADSPPRAVGGPMQGAATRSVSRYLDAERALQDALGRHDQAAVSARLAEDFEARSAAGPDAQSAADWLRSEMTGRGGQAQVRDLWVREFDDLALVSFVLDRRGDTGRVGPVLFVVDVWRRSTDRLLLRQFEHVAKPPPQSLRPNGRE